MRADKLNKIIADDRPLLSTMEAARQLGLDKVSADPKRQIRSMVRDGRLVGVKVGKFLQITPASLDRVRMPGSR